MKGKLAHQLEPGKLVFEDYTLPEVGDDDILVKVVRANVCGSELHIWKGEFPAKKKGGIGHEMVGKIVKLGKNVTTDFAERPVKIGDRVAAVYFIMCNKCNPCNKGQFHLCDNAYEFWTKQPEEHPHFHATFGTHYYIHPKEGQYFYKVPDNVPDSSAASANCALSQVYFGLDKAKVNYGDSVLIQGAGGLGLYAAAVAKEMGAKVIVVDGIKDRLERALEFGADVIINMQEYDTVEKRVSKVNEHTNGNGVDIAMELSGVSAAFSEGIELIRKGGKYISIGNITPGKPTMFDPGLLTRKSIDVYPIARYNPWYLEKSLQFLSRNSDKYPFHELVDATFTLEETELALEKSVNREVTRASILIE